MVNPAYVADDKFSIVMEEKRDGRTAEEEEDYLGKPTPEERIAILAFDEPVER